MKKLALLTCAFATFVLVWQDADAQRASSRRTNTGRTNTVAATAPAPAVVDTPVVQVNADTLPLPGMLPSRRPGTTVVGVDVMEKTPLPYDQIRLDDVVYKQVLWREIVVDEKMNLPFKYDGQDDYGSQRLFNILLRAIGNGDVTAFSNVNDRFTTPITTGEISTMLSGQAYTIQIVDYDRDPDGSLGYMKDTVIRDEFDENTIVAYRLKEEVIFDRETSRMHFRTIGIAPVKVVRNDDGSIRGGITLFWLYYPDLRPILARHEAYNARNMALRMTWEEIFEARYYTSYIYKSTLNNPRDLPLAGLIQDPLHRLLEGDNIKTTIFDWEQNQWSY